MVLKRDRLAGWSGIASFGAVLVGCSGEPPEKAAPDSGVVIETKPCEAGYLYAEVNGRPGCWATCSPANTPCSEGECQGGVCIALGPSPVQCTNSNVCNEFYVDMGSPFSCEMGTCDFP